MNKNQKIAVGCGGAGCLGLIVLAIGCAVGYYIYTQNSPASPAPVNANSNSNTNTNTNTNGNTNTNSNRADNQNTNNTPNSPLPAPPNQSSSSYSDDDKHKLFQAAGITKDQELILRVMKKIELVQSDNTPTAEYPAFVNAHYAWASRNAEFVKSILTPEKARAYIAEHL